MKILFVAAGFPFPPFKGYQVRSWYPLRLLGKRHEIDLIAPIAGRVSPDDLNMLRSLVRQMAAVPHGKLRQIANLVRGSFSPLPWQTSLYDSPAIRRQIRSWRAERAYDVAIVQLARLAGVMPALEGLPVVFDLIDSLSSNMRRRAAADRFPLSLIAGREAARLLKLERDLCDRCAAAVVVSEADADAIGGEKPPRVIPNGVEMELFGYRGLHNRSDVIFSGNMGYFPNAEAALLLVRQVMPLVWKSIPGVRLRIVGDNPTAALKQAASERVIVAGRVAEMAPCLQGAAVAAFPLRSGSGMQNKILESAACGAPIVTTTLAASGFGDFTPGMHGLIADDVQQCADGIVTLLRDPVQAGRISMQARRWVETSYGWDAVVQKMEKVLAAAAAGPAQFDNDNDQEDLGDVQAMPVAR